MSILEKIRQYMDNNPRLKPYLLMWLRKTTKTINEWPQEKFINGVMDCYERRVGYRFDINNPVTFNEKLQWYKVFYQRDDFGYITDKVTFKEYIKNKLGGGYTIPMYGWWDNVKDFKRDWDKLPEEFVLKSNLAANASGVMIIKKKSEVDFKDLKKKVSFWLKKRNTLLNSWDCHFYNSTPKILAEKYMSNFEGHLLDYKFFCFNGKPYCLYVQQKALGAGSDQLIFYRLDWSRIDASWGQVGDREFSKPKHFQEMIRIAKVLSEGFPFVRVDFFDTEDKLYVGELTFAPGGGCGQIKPLSFQKELGDMFILPIDGTLSNTSNIG
jgi:hypothetical protein